MKHPSEITVFASPSKKFSAIIPAITAIMISAIVMSAILSVILLLFISFATTFLNPLRGKVLYEIDARSC